MIYFLCLGAVVHAYSVSLSPSLAKAIASNSRMVYHSLFCGLSLCWVCVPGDLANWCPRLARDAAQHNIMNLHERLSDFSSFIVWFSRVNFIDNQVVSMSKDCPPAGPGKGGGAAPGMEADLRPLALSKVSVTATCGEKQG